MDLEQIPRQRSATVVADALLQRFQSKKTVSTQWAQIRVGYPRLAKDTGLREEERLRAAPEHLAETHINYNGSARKSTNPIPDLLPSSALSFSLFLAG